MIIHSVNLEYELTTNISTQTIPKRKLDKKPR